MLLLPDVNDNDCAKLAAGAQFAAQKVGDKRALQLFNKK
jgi:hypothetical protein